MPAIDVVPLDAPGALQQLGVRALERAPREADERLAGRFARAPRIGLQPVQCACLHIKHHDFARRALRTFALAPRSRHERRRRLGARERFKEHVPIAHATESAHHGAQRARQRSCALAPKERTKCAQHGEQPPHADAQLMQVFRILAARGAAAVRRDLDERGAAKRA